MRLSRSDQVARRAKRGALRSKVARGRARATRIGVPRLEPGSQPKVRPESEDVCAALESAEPEWKSDNPPRLLQLLGTTTNLDCTRTTRQTHPTTVKPDFTCVYFQNVRLLLAGAFGPQTGSCPRIPSKTRDARRDFCRSITASPPSP